MSLHFSDTKSFSRKQNKSAVASIAYRSGTKLHDERNDKTHNYEARKNDVLSADIILPSAFLGADIELDRATIWNNAERAEKRKDARVAREWLINLPHQLDEQTRKQLAHSFAQKLADRYNVIADCCIHKPSDKEIKKGADPRNFHAHIMLTTREIDIENGQIIFTKKAISELSDTDRKKLGLSRMSDEMIAIKQIWDDTANPVLQAHGLSKMDYRSHKKKGDDLLPQMKMGVNATQLERQGKRTRLGDINRDIKQKNEIIFESRRQYERETDTFIKTSNRNITERKRTFEQTEYSITYINDRLELNPRQRAFRLSLIDEIKREIDFTTVTIARTNYEIRGRNRTFDDTEFNIKYVNDGLELNARERAFRISLADRNEREFARTNSDIEQRKRTASDTDNDIKQRKQATDGTDKLIKDTAQRIDEKRIERERIAKRERDLSVARLARSLPLTKHEKNYDFEYSNIVFDEFLKLHEPLPSEQVALYPHVGLLAKDINRAMTVYSNGLLSVSHREIQGRDIKRTREYFELSDVADINTFSNNLEFKNVGISLKIEYENINFVKLSMTASEQNKRQPPQPPATPKPTLEQPKAEPTQPTAYKPRF